MSDIRSGPVPYVPSPLRHVYFGRYLARPAACLALAGALALAGLVALAM